MPTLLRPTLVLLLLFTLVTGILYPLVTTGIAQALFPHEANGSLVTRRDRVIGSELVGQPFTSPGYFWGRPSATSAHAYDASASAGSNLGPSNPALEEAMRARVVALRAADPGAAERDVPVDLVTASGSGLDPHVSVAAARYQAPRVARARGLHEEDVLTLVTAHTEERTLGLLGEPCVNVLALNLALDDLVRRAR
jgi:K+-transporting ATPase ATPase C chain